MDGDRGPSGHQAPGVPFTRVRWIGFGVAGIAVAVAAVVVAIVADGVVVPIVAAAAVPVAMLSGWVLAPQAIANESILVGIVRLAVASTTMAWIAIAVLLFGVGGAIMILFELWSLRLGELGAAVATTLPGAVDLFGSLARPVLVLSVPASALFAVLMRLAVRAANSRRAM
jgi:hypothetical protein